MSKIPLCSYKHMQIFDDQIRFESRCLPWGKKDVILSHVRKVSEKNIELLSGKLRKELKNLVDELKGSIN